MKKKLKPFDIAIGALAGTGVWGKLHYVFNNEYMQRDLITTVGFEIAAFIAGSIIATKCADWAFITRTSLGDLIDEIGSEKYASPKGE